MIGIVAANHKRIRKIVEDLGLAQRNVHPIPIRSIDVAARGRVLDTLLVDHTAAGVDLSDVLPALHGSRGPVYTLAAPQGG